ncbi:MAG TPA: hypothetical protein VGF17_23200 [Phytomonospora sp.]
MTRTMRDRVRLALDLAPGAVPPRFEAAYRRGGTPTSLHLATLAEAAGTSPRWLMTGRPEEHALQRNPAMPEPTPAALTRLAEAAAARRAWMQYEPHMREIICDALTAGANARSVARDLDVSESYVYRVWRERPRQAADDQ